MNTSSLIVVLIMQWLFLGKAQVLFFNQQCFMPKSIENFNITRYLGKWYEIAKYPNFFQRGDCSETNIIPTNDKSQIVVLNKEVNDGHVWGTTGYIQVLKHESSNMKLALKTSFFGYRTTDYNILGTDYMNWAIVSACRNFRANKLEPFRQKQINAWILSRRRYLMEEEDNQIQEVISSSELSIRQFQFTNHAGCPDLDPLPTSYYYA